MSAPETGPVRWAALVAVAAIVACSGSRADTGGPLVRGELRVTRKPVEDVFLLTGDLSAVRSVSLNAPRGEGAPDPVDGRGRLGGEGARPARRVRPRPPHPDDRGAAPEAPAG